MGKINIRIQAVKFSRNRITHRPVHVSQLATAPSAGPIDFVRIQFIVVRTCTRNIPFHRQIITVSGSCIILFSMAMNQTTTNDGSQQMAVLKSLVIWSSTIFGLLGNVFALLVTCCVKIGFPATRLLLRLQFIWDGLGCIVLSAYWATFSQQISLEVQNGLAFRYLWSSYLFFWFTSALSATNILLLAFDRFWAIIWFRSYPRESKRYMVTLVVVVLMYATIVVSPTLGISYCFLHLPMFGMENLNLLLRGHSICVFVFCFLVPGILITVFQLRILYVVGRMQTSSSLINPVVQSTAALNSRSVRDVTIGILIILLTFLVVRSYAYFQYVLVAYGLIDFTGSDNWSNEGIFVYAISYAVDPLTLIFTSGSTRKLLLKKVSVLYAESLHSVSRVFKIHRGND